MKHESDILRQIKHYFMRRKSSEEARNFELEIEKDNFLYEAIEGFENAHVSEIQQALDELELRIDKKARSTLFDSVNWKMVASILGPIIGGSIILGIVLTNNKDQPVTQNDVSIESGKYEPRASEIEFPTISDSIHIVGFDLELDSVEEAPKPANSDEVQVAAAESKKPGIEKIAPKEVTQKKEALKPDTDELALASEELSEEVHSTNNQVLIDPLVPEKEQESMKAIEKRAILAIPAEAVKNFSNYDSMSADVPQATKANEPSIGKAAYNQYLKTSLNKTVEMTSGIVRLSFDFDKEGKPKNIKVEKSLCEACDQEAIRLIEVGPAWNVEDRKTRMNYSITIP